GEEEFNILSIDIHFIYTEWQKEGGAGVQREHFGKFKQFGALDRKDKGGNYIEERQNYEGESVDHFTII
ncbi:MAG: hypothetical protein AAB893_04140, partial [Patescibacteria group bacterium]